MGRAWKHSAVVGLSILWGVLGCDAGAQAQPSLLPKQDEPSPAASGDGDASGDPEAALRVRIAEWQAQASGFRKAEEEAPAELLMLAEERQRAPAESEDAGLDAAELSRRLSLAEQELGLLIEQAEQLEAEPARRAERRKAIPGLIASSRDRLRELDTSAPPAGADASGRALHALRREALLAEISAYQAELASYDARRELLSLRRDVAALRVKRQQSKITRLRARLKDAQRDMVRREAERARELLAEVDALPQDVRGAVRAVAEENAALSALWAGKDGLLDKLSTVSERLTRARAQVAAVEGELDRLTLRVEAAGLGGSVGALLRRERAKVPDIGMYERFVRMRSEQIAEAQLQQLRLTEKRDELVDVEARVRDALATVEGLEEAERARVEQLLRELFASQRAYMDALLADHEEYFQKLVDFDAEQRELIERGERLIAFINERVLWVPSSTPLDRDVFHHAGVAAGWLSSRAHFAQLGRAAPNALAQRPVLHVLVLLAAGLLLVSRRRLWRTLAQASAAARDADNTRFLPTAKATAGSLVLGGTLPAVLGYAADALGRAPAATQFVRSVAHGLLAAALAWASLGIPRALLAAGGVADVHCGWAEAPRLRRMLGWLLAAMVPCSFFIFSLELHPDEPIRESLGRLAFMLLMALTALFGHVSLRAGGPLNAVLRAHPFLQQRGWIARAVHGIALAGPVALLVAAASGFYWTALQLAIRQHLTLVFGLMLLLAGDLLNRWASLAQRSVAKARAEQGGALRVPEGEAPGEETRASVVTDKQAAGEALDLATVSTQTHRLTAGALTLAGVLGGALIWADLVPAAGVLRKVELWHVVRKLPLEGAAQAGTQLAAAPQLVAITLADLLLGLAVAALSWVLLRNLPGLLEVTLFRRLHAGERYAIATMLKYAIGLTGLTMALDAVGIGWSNVQWLVAAVGLGLGFGLQEIFANFVSGLLILIERPIRVGDTVTIGAVSGTVSRIQIRATRITAFDRKELVVPNKEFVTSQLINWSLSDPMLRVDVPVGIAYGSDTGRAVSELLRVARHNPLVLREPPPQALFLSFGDSALGFELRVFVGDSSDALKVKHELHMAIDRAFREAGIEIAFPQTDVHLRSVPQGVVSMLVPGQKGSSAVGQGGDA